MAPYLIIGSEKTVNAQLERLLEDHCTCFDEYPGWRALEPWVEACVAVFVTASPAEGSIAIVSSLNACWPDLPIICVGENWSAGEQMRALTFGAQGYLAYPVHANLLWDHLARIPTCAGSLCV